MKKFKAIVPALAMLLVSAVLLGTSTFAWFSMNDEVSVSGMQITAKSDQVYLIVGSTNDLAAIQGTNEKAVTLTEAPAKAVKPVQPKAAAYTNTTEAGKAGNWEWYVAADKGASAEDTDTRADVTDLSEYVLTKKVYVTVAKGSAPSGNLVLKSVEFKKGGAPIEYGGVVVTSATGGVRYDSGEKSLINKAANKLADSVTDSALVELDIYVYIYGADASVYTNNFANLGEISVDLTFAVLKG